MIPTTEDGCSSQRRQYYLPDIRKRQITRFKAGRELQGCAHQWSKVSRGWSMSMIGVGERWRCQFPEIELVFRESSHQRYRSSKHSAQAWGFAERSLLQLISRRWALIEFCLLFDNQLVLVSAVGLRRVKLRVFWQPPSFDLECVKEYVKLFLKK